jgi:hypothetical protein
VNNKERLNQLKKLKVERKAGALFRSSDECMKWIDNVSPLLKYDNNHYETFNSNAQFVRVSNLSADRLMSHLNPMIGVVDQAIFELENKIKPFSPVQAVKNVWHESFFGKILLIIITILLTFAFTTYVFPLVTKKEGIQQQQEATKGSSPQPKNIETVPIENK